MPQTKYEEFVFTLMTSGVMIFIMGVYNVALNTGGLSGAVFHHAVYAFPFEWLVGFLLAFLIAGKTARYFAFKIVQPGDRPIFIILCIQTFTVCTMVPLMSLFGTVKASGLTSGLLCAWLQTIFLNFIMAYPLQIFVAGPLCRRVFGILFRR